MQQAAESGLDIMMRVDQQKSWQSNLRQTCETAAKDLHLQQYSESIDMGDAAALLAEEGADSLEEALEEAGVKKGHQRSMIHALTVMKATHHLVQHRVEL